MAARCRQRARASRGVGRPGELGAGGGAPATRHRVVRAWRPAATVTSQARQQDARARMIWEASSPTTAGARVRSARRKKSGRTARGTVVPERHACATDARAVSRSCPSAWGAGAGVSSGCSPEQPSRRAAACWARGWTVSVRVRSSLVRATPSALRRVVARATSVCPAPWPWARGWSARAGGCVATSAWRVASGACRVARPAWARPGCRRTERRPSPGSTSAHA